jgi:hypothetical protein
MLGMDLPSMANSVLHNEEYSTGSVVSIVKMNGEFSLELSTPY